MPNEWKEGYIACGRGVGRHRNPYVRDSEEYEDWRNGWSTHFHGEWPASEPAPKELKDIIIDP